MRFLANGPSIPDDLLVARDAGDVIFFCGAGVSRHRAGLPDFIKLGGDVIKLLGAGEKSLARKLFDRIGEMKPMDGVGGLIATDRIFSLLEREFEKKDIENAVARAIHPTDPVDLSAHQTLVDLSRGRDGVVRIVTTNFDLLFEASGEEIGAYGPPPPDPRGGHFAGIVHLHGRVNNDYSGAGDEEFIISSADFGRAYLSDGWATRFMQALLARFQIVFVGYAADDPPVQYLLEALNLKAGSRSRLFAFQAGNNDDDAALWEHRGVRAISFDNSKSYDPLWDSLAAWATRARDVDAWYEALLAAASAGPVPLDSHVRGQIAHVISTREGARRLGIATTTLAASWLLVFDPHERYASPGPLDGDDESLGRFDPYQSLALDFDTPPQPADDGDDWRDRKIPEGAWDGFAPTRADQEDQQFGFGEFRGGGAGMAGTLSERMRNLAIWFTRVAHQPIALWWAAGRGPLHPRLVDSIQSWLRQEPDRWPADIRDGWRRLIASWSDRRVPPDHGYFDLRHRVEREGWSESLVRAYADLFRPQLRIERKFGIGHPLTWTDANRPTALLSYGVDYPHPHGELTIPEMQLAYAVTRFRDNLALARSMEAEISGADHIYMQTTRADDGEPAIAYDSYGITGPIAQFQGLMARLAATAPALARAEIAAWPVDDHYIFGRLRIWAAGSQATSPTESADILLGFPDDVFWGSTHQRDLLYAIRDRWSEYAAEERARIEARLLTTSYPWTEKTRGGKTRAEAHYRLDRLQWLNDQGVTFSFNFDAEKTALRLLAPDWTEQSAMHAADSNAPVVRSVEVDINPGTLDDVPVSEILDRAGLASMPDFFDLEEHRPFTGLAEVRPVRALAALSDAARKGNVPASFWSAFLYVEQRKTDRPRLVRAIARRLVSLSPEGLSTIAYPVTEWLRVLGERVFIDLPPLIDCLWGPLMAALPLRDDNRPRKVDTSWANDALNAPVGKLVEVLLGDPAVRNPAPEQGFPAAWTDKLMQLLGLPGDMRRHALVMLGYRVNWLFAIDPAWTEQHLLGVADDMGDDGDALWDGILWAARAPSRALYERVKPALLARAMSPTRRRAEANVVAGFVLLGWGGSSESGPPEQLVTNAELREILIECDDDLRRQMLWHLEHWSADLQGNWRGRLIPFLTEVWPHHRALRTPEVSARLADLALASGDLFPQVVPVIVPRLVPVRQDVLRGISHQNGEADHPARLYPAAMLDLLWAILGEDVSQWPYRVEDVLEILAEAPATRGDPRLSELRRRRLS
ncbi:SIR2 family protein [Rhizobium sp. A37_96]